MMNEGDITHPHFEITKQMESQGKTSPPCGSGTLFTQTGAIRLFCGRKDCPNCFAWRKNKAIKKIRGAIAATQDGEAFYYAEVPKEKKSATLKRLYRADISYCVFPQQDYVLLMVQNDGLNLLENMFEFNIVPDDDLETWLDPYLDTPDGERVSFSRNFPKPKKEERKNPLESKEMEVPKLGKVQFVINMELNDFCDYLTNFGVEVYWPYRSFDRISYTLTNEQWEEIIEDLENKGHELFQYKRGVQIDP